MPVEDFMHKELIRGFSTIMAAAILASIIPACGGSGGSGSAGAAPAPAATPDHKLHISVPVSGIACPASTVTVLKSSVFVPTTADDFIHGIYASCTMLTPTAGTATFSLTVQDVNGIFLINKTGVVGIAGPFTDPVLPAQIRVSTPIFFDTQANASYPSTTYTVKFSISTDGVFVGTASNVVLKALVSDNTTVVTNSTNWN
jgi:hypothetical protein